MEVLSSPSLSDWVLSFRADGSGGQPPVAIVLTHSVLTRGVSCLARWPYPLGHSKLHSWRVWCAVTAVWGALQNGMDAQLADIPPHNNKAVQVIKSSYPGWTAHTLAHWLDQYYHNLSNVPQKSVAKCSLM